MFTKQQVQDMSEKDLRQQVLIPLLKAMKYQDVREYHGPNEFGKDIVGWQTDNVDQRENLALVVKATAVSGQSAASADIENQVRQCFGKPYIDPVTGSEEEIDRCWVVSNKPISPQAIDLIKSGIGHAVYAKNVIFLGIDKLWDLIEKHMPLLAALQKLEEVQREYDALDPHYRVVTQLDGGGIHQTLTEKYPGAFQAKPLSFHVTFEFPKTDEGKAQMEALEHFRATGTPVRIPRTFIKNLEYPDIMKQIYPEMTADGFLEFGPLPHPKPLFMKCEIVCDDGDYFVVEHIHLTCIKGGEKEITLTNKDQPIPFKVEQVIRFDGSKPGFHLNLEFDLGFNVHQELLYLHLMRCISKPHVMSFTSLETGMTMASGRNNGACEAPDEEFLDVLAALDALQIKSRKLVHIPRRSLTEEELQSIGTVRSAFHTGMVGFSWSNLSALMIITDENRNGQMQELQRFVDGRGFAHIPEQEEILHLFGEQYTLGPVKAVALPLTLVNQAEAKAILGTDYCGTIELDFVPPDDGHFVKEYVLWLPGIDTLPSVSPDESRSVE